MSNTDDARLLIKSVEAIAVASTEDGGSMNEELCSALFWGMAHLAREAADLLDVTPDDRDQFIQMSKDGAS